jgi:hypothetical protein
MSLLFDACLVVDVLDADLHAAEAADAAADDDDGDGDGDGDGVGDGDGDGSVRKKEKKGADETAAARKERHRRKAERRRKHAERTHAESVSQGVEGRITGKGMKGELLQWFCRSQLEAYSSIFYPGKDGGSLEQTDRRFHWLRRTLRAYDDTFAHVFPAHWEVPALLTYSFGMATREHMSKILSSDSDHIDVKVLIQALQKCLDFEGEMSVRFRTGESGFTMGGDDVDGDQVGVITPFIHCIVFLCFLHGTTSLFQDGDQVGVITLASVNHYSLTLYSFRSLPYQVGVITLASVNHYLHFAHSLSICALFFYRTR